MIIMINNQQKSSPPSLKFLNKRLSIDYTAIHDEISTALVESKDQPLPMGIRAVTSILKQRGAKFVDATHLEDVEEAVVESIAHQLVQVPSTKI